MVVVVKDCGDVKHPGVDPVVPGGQTGVGVAEGELSWSPP